MREICHSIADYFSNTKEQQRNEMNTKKSTKLDRNRGLERVTMGDLRVGASGKKVGVEQKD